MEQISACPRGKTALHMKPLTQQVIVDGYKVKISFLPQENKAPREDVLKCIRNTLLAVSFAE